MTTLEDVMRLNCILARNETNATAAFFKSCIVKAGALLSRCHGRLLSLRIPLRRRPFPPKAQLTQPSTLRAEPQATWLLLLVFCLAAFDNANGHNASANQRGGRCRFVANNRFRRSHRHS